MEEQLELEDAVKAACIKDSTGVELVGTAKESAVIQAELDKAFEKAKEFHPITKVYIDGYTGEVNRYKTPDNYVPDEGVVNDLPDLCHTEDHVTIQQMYQRLANIKALSIQDSDFDYDEGSVSPDDLDEDTISDVVAEVDDPSDYDNYVNDFINEKVGSTAAGEASEQQRSDSAGQKSAVDSKNEDKATEVAANE
uniref:Uncharacterized protein n=1 Tax=Dulem virus 98 TaxID=3145809 RepID=A0AAU8B945_9VIRU